jgi:hypothetical protein
MDPSPRPPGLLRTALGSLAYIAFVNAGLLAVRHVVLTGRDGWSLFGAFVVDSAIVLFSSVKANELLGGGKLMAVPVVLFLGFGFYYHNLGGHLPALIHLRETPLIAVKEADRYPGYDVFHLEDGSIDRRGEFSWSATRYKSGYVLHYRVAPIVPEGWTKSDRITLWAAEMSSGEFAPASWQKPLRGGRKIDDDANLRRLVDETAERKGYRSVPGVQIISWSDHPKEDLMADVHLELGILLVIDLLVLVALLIRG